MKIYEGIFIDYNNFYSKIIPTLDRVIANPHITLNYKPKYFHTEWVGEKVEIICNAYGRDNENEGFQVQLIAKNPNLQKAIDNIEIPHITISVSKNGKPVNTKNLIFEPIKEIKFVGVFNIFSV